LFKAYLIFKTSDTIFVVFFFLEHQIHVKESLWRSLEEDMIPTMSSKSNWLELQSKMLPKKFKESNICVAGGK